MSILEQGIQEVDLNAVEEALGELDDKRVAAEEETFEKALGREGRRRSRVRMPPRFI